MRAVKEETLNELEDTVGPALKAVRAYLNYQGDNPQYRDKAARCGQRAITARDR